LLGVAQSSAGQKAAAVVTYERLVSLQPKSAVAYYRLGTVQAANGNSSAAASSLKKALELKPDFVEPAVDLAHIEANEGRTEEAVKIAQNLQRTLPKSPVGLLLEGDVRIRQNRSEEALKAYQRAVALQPTGIGVVKLYAAEIRAGDAKRGEAHVEEWMKAHPEDVTTLQLAASESQRAGRDKVAISQYERIIQMNPSDAASLNNLALLYHRTKDSRALTAAQSALKLAPTSSAVAHTLGWILVDQGKTAEGLVFLQKAAAADARNAEVHYHLAVALAKSGEKAKARRELESLLATNPNFTQRDDAQALLKQL
jgi:putative PEP-CTERM system TPR-repeat lipoprotein